MDRKNLRGSQKLIVSVVGVALAVPLIAAPASAALDGGKFQIRAVSTDDSTIVGTRGMKGLSAPTDPSTDPGTSNPALSVVSKCGPLSYTITPAMADLSSANIKAASEGRTGDIKATADGWKFIWAYSPDSGTVVSTPPAQSDDLKLFYLGDSATAPDVISLITSVPSDAKLSVYTYDSEGYCSMTDLRGAKTVGKTFSYLKSGNDYTEGRYESLGGNTVYTTVRSPFSAGSGVTYQQFFRGTNPNNLSASAIFRSSTYLSNGTVYSDGRKDGAINLPSAVDGADRLQFSFNADGSGGVSYIKTNADGSTTIPNRKNAPVSISFDATGKMTQIGYNDPSNPDNLKYLVGSDATAAKYNSVTGQSWNGSYDNGKSYDYSLPFQPQVSNN